MIFQSTLPAREATNKRLRIGGLNVISIHASREGSDDIVLLNVADFIISIHASREGSDVGATTQDAETTRISIHASREGSDRI